LAVLVGFAIVLVGCGSVSELADSGTAPETSVVVSSRPSGATAGGDDHVDVGLSEITGGQDGVDAFSSEQCRLEGVLPAIDALVAGHVDGTVEPAKVSESTRFGIADIDVWSVNISDVYATKGEGSLVGLQEIPYVSSTQRDGYVSTPERADVASVAGRDVGLMLAPYSGASGPNQIVGLFALDGAGQPVFKTGRCAASFQEQLMLVADFSGRSPMDALIGWVMTPVDPATGTNEYSGMLEAAERLARQQSDDSGWYAADPAQRSLDPGDVPDAVRTSLDVVAVQLDISGVGPNEVVIIRSESGVSVAVAASVLPVLQPAFFTSNDTSIELALGTSAADTAASTLANITVKGSPRANGYRLRGTADAPILEPMTDAALLEFLGLSSVDELAAVRSALLGR